MKPKILLPEVNEWGRIPPQCVEIEEAVLGALMNNNDAIYSIYSLIKPYQFYKDEHQKICQAIFDLVDQNKNIDLLMVQQQLLKKQELEEIGGPAYLTELLGNTSYSYKLTDHCLIIHAKFVQRELIRYTSELSALSFDDSIDISDIETYAQEELYKITEDLSINEAVRVDKIMNSEIEIINKLVAKQIKLIGITSGYNKLDRLTGGWQKPNLILIAARPSMGKTAFMLYLARNAALLGIPVIIFSLEMSIQELIRRLISYNTGINSMNIAKGSLTNSELIKLEDTLHKFTDIPLYIDDTPSLSIYEMNARIRRYRMKYKIELATVDYIQLMKGDKTGNREQEISSISRGLKASCKNNDIPIIALSQLNRSVEMRGSKRPQLSDLRESGSLEQDADMVIFIHRPEKYGESSISTDSGELSTKELIDIIIAKYRNGKQGDIIFWSNDSFTTFRENFDETNFVNEEIPF